MRILVLIIVLFLTICELSSSNNKIYERYEKHNSKDNSTQIIEIFRTKNRPPSSFDSEKELEDFIWKNSNAEQRKDKSDFNYDNKSMVAMNHSFYSTTPTGRPLHHFNRTRWFSTSTARQDYFTRN